MYNAVVYDVEATPGPEKGQSRIHTICLIPVVIDGKKRTVTPQRGVMICVRDVLRREEVNLKTDVKNKVAQSVIDVATYNLNIKYLDFHDAIVFMNKFVVEHGSMLIGHNIAGDLDFMAGTQDFVGGKRVIKKKIKDFPDSGMYDPNWKNIVKVCTMSLFANRCPKMNVEFRKFVTENDIQLTDGGFIPLKLHTYTQFARGEPMYKQTHSAVQDTVDLIGVLKSAVWHDGENIIDGYSYMAKPEWMRGVIATAAV
jgi:hypothetical protein